MSPWLGAILVGVGICVISWLIINWAVGKSQHFGDSFGKIFSSVIIGVIGTLIFFLASTVYISGPVVDTRNNLITHYGTNTHILRWSEEAKAYESGFLKSIPIYSQTFRVIIDPAIAKLHLEITVVPGEDDESIMAQYERIISHGDTLEAYIRRLTFLYETRGLSQNLDNFPNDYIKFLEPLLKASGVKGLRIFINGNAVPIVTQIE
ncbi:MAG: hypothetical protein WC242_05390 [Candidatus Paceibacterota bacterium]|jgi:hypothetical protein